MSVVHWLQINQHMELVAQDAYASFHEACLVNSISPAAALKETLSIVAADPDPDRRSCMARGMSKPLYYGVSASAIVAALYQNDRGISESLRLA